jgi:hypothetical protein
MIIFQTNFCNCIISLFCKDKAYKQKKEPHFSVKLLPGGERGIRTPGPVTVNGFQDRRIRPLCHLSFTSKGLQNYPFFMFYANIYCFLFYIFFGLLCIVIKYTATNIMPIPASCCIPIVSLSRKPQNMATIGIK